MAGLLRGSRRWLGLTRAFQGVGVTCTDCALETGLRLQTGASFATLPNKARQSKAQAKKSDPDAAESQPDQPRTRAASAFNFFAKDAFKAIKDKHPESRPTVSTAMPEISAKWKALPDEEKQPYIEASQANKQNQPSRKSGKGGKGSKALSAYNMFVKEKLRKRESSKPHNTAQTNFAEDGSRMEDSWNIRKAEVQGTG